MDATQRLEDTSLEEGDEAVEDRNSGKGKEPLAKLRVFKNEHFPETEFPLFLGENVLGRDPASCSLLLSARSVSKRHAVISLSLLRGNKHRGEGVMEALLWDLGSMNGTRRGRFRLTPHVRYALGEGESVLIADLPCQFVRVGEGGAGGSVDTPSKTETGRGKGTLRRVAPGCVSDSDSEGEISIVRERRAKLFVPDSESPRESSLACSSFLTPTSRFVPDSEEESSITASSSGHLDRSKTGKTPRHVSDSDPEEEKEASRDGSAADSRINEKAGPSGALPPAGPCRNQADFKIHDSESDSDTKEEDPAVTNPESAGVKAPPVVDVKPSSGPGMRVEEFHLDSDTDVEEEVNSASSPAQERGAEPPPTAPTVQPIQFHLDSDTDTEDRGEDPSGLASRESSSQPKAAEVTPQELHYDSDPDAEEAGAKPEQSTVAMAQGLEILSDSGSDTDDDSALPSAPVAAAQQSHSQAAVPDTAPAVIAACPETDSDTDLEEFDSTEPQPPAKSNPDLNFNLDSDTDVEDEEGAQGRARHMGEPTSSTPVGSAVREEELETQAFICTSDPFRRPTVPTLLKAKPHDDSQEDSEEDLMLAATQCFVSEGQKSGPPGDLALEATQPFSMDPSLVEEFEDQPTQAFSFQLGVSHSCEATQPYDQPESGEDSDLETTQAYEEAPPSKRETERLEREEEKRYERERLEKDKNEREEQERLEKEKEEKEKREAEERLELEKKEWEENQRLKKEAKQREEKERLVREMKERKENERLEREQKEREERKRLEQEKKEREEMERLEKERKEREEKEKLEKQRREVEEKERLKKEKRDREEKERLEKEQKEKEEKERLKKEQIERERLEKEKKEQEEREHLEKEKKEREKRERLEKEKKEREERERLEKEKKEWEERERLEKEKKEREEGEILEKEKTEREERERLEKEKKEWEERERLEKEKKEQEERERLEKEKKEQEEGERLEKEKKEQEARERQEKERKDKEEKERLEREKKEVKAEKEASKYEEKEDTGREMNERPDRKRRGRAKERLAKESKQGEGHEGMEMEGEAVSIESTPGPVTRSRRSSASSVSSERSNSSTSVRRTGRGRCVQGKMEPKTDPGPLSTQQNIPSTPSSRGRGRGRRSAKAASDLDSVQPETSPKDDPNPQGPRGRSRGRKAVDAQPQAVDTVRSTADGKAAETKGSSRGRSRKVSNSDSATTEMLPTAEFTEGKSEKEMPAPSANIVRGRSRRLMDLNPTAAENKTAILEPSNVETPVPRKNSRTRGRTRCDSDLTATETDQTTDNLATSNAETPAPTANNRGRGKARKGNDFDSTSSPIDKSEVPSETANEEPLDVGATAPQENTRARGRSRKITNSDLVVEDKDQSMESVQTSTFKTPASKTTGRARGRGRKVNDLDLTSAEVGKTSEPTDTTDETDVGAENPAPEANRRARRRGRNSSDSDVATPDAAQTTEVAGVCAVVEPSKGSGQARGQKRGLDIEEEVSCSFKVPRGQSCPGLKEGKVEEVQGLHEEELAMDSEPSTTHSRTRAPVALLKKEQLKKGEEAKGHAVQNTRRGKRAPALKKEEAEEDDGRDEGSNEDAVSAPSSEEQDVPRTPTGKNARKRVAPSESPSATKIARGSMTREASPGGGGRTRALTQAYKVLFTGLTDPSGEAVVPRLGGSLAKGVNDMTHLVTDKVRRTVKFLCAVARGIPIVTTNWLEKSGKQGSFLPPSEFLVKDVEQEQKFSFCLEQSLSTAQTQPLLQGYEIHVTRSVKPEPAQMKDIITCSGARYLPKMPTVLKPDTVVVSCTEDASLCTPALSASIPVVSAEFLLSGILQQRADPVSHALSGPGFKQGAQGGVQGGTKGKKKK